MFDVFNRPFRGQFAITPSDSANLPRLTRSIIVGGAGNVNCVFAGKTTPQVIALTVGEHDLALTKILSTSTTATGLIGRH